MPKLQTEMASKPLVKQETHTQQQPDGTIVTTTTKTETYAPGTLDRDVYYDYEDYYTWTSINVDYCCTPPAILRIAEIVSVIVGINR